MPPEVEPTAEASLAVRQIAASKSKDEFLDHIIDGIRKVDHSVLLLGLDEFSNDRDADIERICSSNHQQFIDSINAFNQGWADCTSLGTEILHLIESYQSGISHFASQKKDLVSSRDVQQNLEESIDALKECVEMLRYSQQIYDLINEGEYYASLRALEVLQDTLYSKENSRYTVRDTVQQSILAMQKMMKDAMLSNLNSWLSQIRENAQLVGEVALFHTELRRSRRKERINKDEYLEHFKLNSSVEIVADELEDYDALENDDPGIHVTWTPLLECLYIHEAPGEANRFCSEYAATRRTQSDLIIPTTLKLDDQDGSELKTLLENIAGFVIIERETLKKTENLRMPNDVDELWDSMCQNALALLSIGIHHVDSAEIVLNITCVVSLFIQTMESYEYYSADLNRFLMTLFEKYSALLQRRCGYDLEEIISTDDFMPMPISNLEEYEKIIEVGWYTPANAREDITFPYIFPFSQMYPMCCIDIRNFLNQLYSAPDEYLQRSSIVDETGKKALDELLCENICKPMVERLNSQYIGQVVQILTNVELFENVCDQLQIELTGFRTSRSRSDPIELLATQAFRSARTKANDRIFELVNSKIDDLIETAEFDWTSDTRIDEPSSYMTELTSYIANIRSSALMGLPIEVNELIFFEAISHIATAILRFPLSPFVSLITPPAVHRLSLDVRHLASFVASMSNSLSLVSSSTPAPSSNRTLAPESKSSALPRALDELIQSVELMASDNPDEFFDIGQRNRRYGNVDAHNATLLLEKVYRGKQEAEATTTTAAVGAGQRITAQATDVGQKKDYAERSEEVRLRAGEVFASAMRGFRRGAEGDRDAAS